MSSRIRASVAARQSLNSLILASVCGAGEFTLFEWLDDFFMGVSLSSSLLFVVSVVAIRSTTLQPLKHRTPRTGSSHPFASQFAGLLHPVRELIDIELVGLADVE